MSITTAITNHVKCLKCGKPGFMTCNCWVNCKCGWHYERDGKCGNPIHRAAKPKRATKAKVRK